MRSLAQVDGSGTATSNQGEVGGNSAARLTTRYQALGVTLPGPFGVCMVTQVPLALRATPKHFSILPPSSAFIVMACFSFIIFSISALLCAGAGVAASDPTAATKAPATSADSVRLDISIPPIGVDLATCAVAVWRAVRRAFPKIRPDDRKGYPPRVRYMTAIGLIFLKYQWIRKHPGGPSAEEEPPSLRSRPVTFSGGRANHQDRHGADRDRGAEAGNKAPQRRAIEVPKRHPSDSAGGDACRRGHQRGPWQSSSRAGRLASGVARHGLLAAHCPAGGD